MPCALTSTMIMSNEYDKDGNNNTSTLSRSSSSCEDLSDDQTKVNSNPTSPSMLPSSPISVCNEPTGDKTVPTKHSFSIDALVGNNTTTESTASKCETTNQEKANSVWNNQFVDLKRIQSYYQNLYSQNGSLPIKQLGNYLYPPQLGANFENGAHFSEMAQSDQLLAYYTNLYLQNSSSFYQERYLESLKTYSANPLDHKPNGFSVDPESHPHRKFNHEHCSDKLSPVSNGDRNETTDTEQNSRKHRPVRCTKDEPSQDQTEMYGNNQILDLHRHKQSSPSEPNPNYNYRSSPPPEQKSQPSKSSPSQSNNQQPSLYGTSSAGLEKPVDLVINNAQQQQNTGLNRPSPAYSHPHPLYGIQHPVDHSQSLNNPNFYPPYCDYNLLLKHNKSGNLLRVGPEDNALDGGAGSAGVGGCNGNNPQSTLLHSPLTPNSDTNGSTSAAAAAAAAYHISNMFRKPKRIRTAFSPGQLLRLEEIFEKNRYVVGCERKQLARDLNLSETQIKVWFQNRRTKHKREKHVGGGSGSGSNGTSGHSSHQSLHHSYHHHHHQQQQQQQLHQSQSNQHRHLTSSEDKKYLHSGMRPSLVTSSASSSLPSTSSVAYLSNSASFQLTSSSSSVYNSHFKSSQANAH